MLRDETSHGAQFAHIQIFPRSPPRGTHFAPGGSPGTRGEGNGDEDHGAPQGRARRVPVPARPSRETRPEPGTPADLEGSGGSDRQRRRTPYGDRGSAPLPGTRGGRGPRASAPGQVRAGAPGGEEA